MLEKLFDFALKYAKTLVNGGHIYQQNQPSLVCGAYRKIGLKVIHEFKFNGNEYYELAFDTSKRVCSKISNNRLLAFGVVHEQLKNQPKCNGK